jgi:enoyl-CoA hydratase/carnithine racemase
MILTRRQFVAGVAVLAVGPKANGHKRRHANMAAGTVTARTSIQTPLLALVNGPAFVIGLSLVGGGDLVGGTL